MMVPTNPKAWNLRRQPPAVFYDTRVELPKYARQAVIKSADAGPVVLIKPESANDPTHPNLMALSQVQIPGLQQDIKRLASVYEHWSTAPEAYEKACFERFIAVDRLCAFLGIDGIWHLDTDVVAGSALFSPMVTQFVSSFDVVASNLPTLDTAYGHPTFAGLAYLKADVLSSFASYLKEEFFPESRIVGPAFLQERIEAGLTGGVCDMTAWAQFLKNRPRLASFDTDRLRLEGAVILNGLYSFGSRKSRLPDALPDSPGATFILSYRQHAFRLVGAGEQLSTLAVHFSGADKQLISNVEDGWSLKLGGFQHLRTRTAFRVRRKARDVMSGIRHSGGR